MNSQRPGVLAVRAINDYRRRDIFGYLGLRYYLDNTAARSDEWAQRVAFDLVMSRYNPGYFNAEQFKDASEGGQIRHRYMSIPGPNEALAEAALLAECAKHPGAFGNPACVYSYALNDHESRKGTFLPYITGLRQRQVEIARACETTPSGVVRYTDIKKFYPSVSVDVARAAWQRRSQLAELARPFRELGEKLLDDYVRAGRQEKHSILTGPMFSHMLANLVFRELDDDFSANLPAKYFRYVDDIILVGNPGDVARSFSVVRDKIASLGLEFHLEKSSKNLEVACSWWLVSRDDFSEGQADVSWMRLIRDLKQFLILQPEQREELHKMFLEHGFRIPVRDYSVATREPDFLDRILRFAPKNWFRRKAQAVTPAQLINQATRLRDHLDGEFRQLFDGAEVLTGFERKRRQTKLRYCAARLVYLAHQDGLRSLGELAAAIPELFFHSRVLLAVSDHNVDRVILMGPNAAQAAAQPLKAAGGEVFTSHREFQPAEEQSLAVLLMNGLKVHRPRPTKEPESETIRFAASGTDAPMMRSTDTFLREIACLHGISSEPRHSGMLDRAFDEDESLAMDAVEQLQQSVSP
jgi:hypothetical protein